MAGISPTIRGGFSKRRTGWLGREDWNFEMANWNQGIRAAVITNLEIGASRLSEKYFPTPFP